MEEWAIFQTVDADSGDMVLFDTGTKEQMSALFESMVINGEEHDFYLVRVVKSAEQVPGDNAIDVKDLGDEDEIDS